MHIFAEHFAGIGRHIHGERRIPDDLDPVVNDGLIVLCQFAVPAGGSGKIDDHRPGFMASTVSFFSRTGLFFPGICAVQMTTSDFMA